MKVSGDLLPSRVYASRVDRFPIFVTKTPSGSPLVTFTYVDAGSPTLKGFITHLEAYEAMLRFLPRFEFIYLAPSDRLFKAAEAEFSRIVLGRFAGNSGEGLLRYFLVRSAWETRQRVAAADVVFLNEAKRQFHGKAFETLFQKWVAGSLEDGEVSCSATCSAHLVLSPFRAQKCGDSLAVFYPASEEWGERSPQKVRNPFSPPFSP